jgi:hypothetical protein
MTQGSAFRLDTVDAAVVCGWGVESTRSTDQFERDGVAILAQYGQDDAITTIVRSREGREDETFGLDSPGKYERLRIWLGIRAETDETMVDNATALPVTAQHLLGQGMNRAAYIKGADGLQLLDIGANDAVGAARDYIRAYDGRSIVYWLRDGSGSAQGDRVWWAEMPLPDGRVVGWFKVNPSFPSR